MLAIFHHHSRYSKWFKIFKAQELVGRKCSKYKNSFLSYCSIVFGCQTVEFYRGIFLISFPVSDEIHWIWWEQIRVFLPILSIKVCSSSQVSQIIVQSIAPKIKKKYHWNYESNYESNYQFKIGEKIRAHFFLLKTSVLTHKTHKSVPKASFPRVQIVTCEIGVSIRRWYKKVPLFRFLFYIIFWVHANAKVWKFYVFVFFLLFRTLLSNE